MQQVAAGDQKAFRVLFDQYKERFYAVARKMTRSDDTAQEMVQEIFIKIWQNRYSLSQVNDADAYLFTILYRQIFRHYKKLALERKLLRLIAESPAFRNVTDETVLARESQRLINEAVAQLPPQQQQVFLLSKQQGLTREQVAEKLRISPNTVRNHLAEAIRHIKLHLKQAALLYLLLPGFLH